MQTPHFLTICTLLLASPIVQAGGITNFSINYNEPGTYQTWVNMQQFVETGPRTNYAEYIKSEVTFTDSSLKFILRTKVKSYDVSGYYQDSYRHFYYDSDNKNPNRSITINGSLGIGKPQQVSLMGSADFSISLVSSFYYWEKGINSVKISSEDGSKDFIPMTSGSSDLYASASALKKLPNGSDNLDFQILADFSKPVTYLGIEITGPQYGFGVRHNTEYEMLDILPLPVPEPSSWLMLLSGSALLGIAMRRRKHT
ncbi:PEP-CTERM sorting domain-containing protein [Massilia sp. erpn]|uniref:PEP-CTERM sorting domain-containing protein n=1 Tax=Massilia sp. erpn TaxID=2738142 RepID=UPI002105C3D1|nr:PEP-CTERM sorting domain-containing protein [Massilia sp. erpn]UTY57511.1 PEP-CTERM sorting domain-containing protein [Massilia sp. erpn]